MHHLSAPLHLLARLPSARHRARARKSGRTREREGGRARGQEKERAREGESERASALACVLDPASELARKRVRVGMLECVCVHVQVCELYVRMRMRMCM